jgi:hypothetical protein
VDGGQPARGSPARSFKASGAAGASARHVRRPGGTPLLARIEPVDRDLLDFQVVHSQCAPDPDGLVHGLTVRDVQPTLHLVVRVAEEVRLSSRVSLHPYLADVGHDQADDLLAESELLGMDQEFDGARPVSATPPHRPEELVKRELACWVRSSGVGRTPLPRGERDAN